MASKRRKGTTAWSKSSPSGKLYAERPPKGAWEKRGRVQIVAHGLILLVNGGVGAGVGKRIGSGLADGGCVVM